MGMNLDYVVGTVLFYIVLVGGTGAVTYLLVQRRNQRARRGWVSVAPGATVSPDGRYWLDNVAWRPVAPPRRRTRAPVAGAMAAAAVTGAVGQLAHSPTSTARPLSHDPAFMVTPAPAGSSDFRDPSGHFTVAFSATPTSQNLTDTSGTQKVPVTIWTAVASTHAEQVDCEPLGLSSSSPSPELQQTVL